jgi:hypothetical protein
MFLILQLQGEEKIRWDMAIRYGVGAFLGKRPRKKEELVFGKKRLVGGGHYLREKILRLRSLRGTSIRNFNLQVFVFSRIYP